MNRNPIPEPVYDRIEIIRESRELPVFTVESGVGYQAPEGYLLSMTVNGVETPFIPGTYEGKVSFCVRKAIPQPFECGYFSKGPVDMRAAIYVTEEGVQRDHSVTEALTGADVTNQGVSGGKLASGGKCFNGIIVNNADYSISHMEMELTGRGGDDFAGIGAALVTGGNANVTLTDSKITTSGVIRGAMTAGGHSSVTFRNCEVMANGGSKAEEAETPGMNCVPWPLGLSGNCRATNVVQWATVVYDHCAMRSYGWGVLSTDATEGASLTARDCLIEITGPSGYGTYCIGNNVSTFDHCTFRVPDYALIFANEPCKCVLTNGTEADCGRNAVLIHSNKGSTLRVEKGCRLVSRQATFLSKLCHPTLEVDDCVLEPKNGVILQMMDSDDAGLFGEAYIVPDMTVMERQKFDVTADHTSDLHAVFSNMEINGDFYNASTGKIVTPGGSRGGDPYCSATNLVLTLRHVTANSTISAATCAYVNVPVGGAITPENCKELGNVISTPAPAVNNGVILTLESATWNVTGDSYLTALTVDGASDIHGSVTVNGTPVVPVPGVTYTGSIVVTK